MQLTEVPLQHHIWLGSNRRNIQGRDGGWRKDRAGRSVVVEKDKIQDIGEAAHSSGDVICGDINNCKQTNTHKR